MGLSHRRIAVGLVAAAALASAAPASLDFAALESLQVSGAIAEAPLASDETGPVVAMADAGDLTFREAAIPNANAEMMQDAAAAAPAKDPEAWDFKWELGFAGAFGNTDTQNLQTAFRAKKEREGIDRIHADALYFWGATDGDTDQNKFVATARYDYFINESAFFLWVDGRYDYDQFQSWNHRVSFHAGPGWDAIKKDDFTLTLLAGLGAMKEWGSDREEWAAEGLLGLDLNWKMSERQNFTLSTRYFPDFDESGEFRTVTTASWTMKLDEWDGVSLNAGLYHEYLSQIDPGRDHNDWRIYAGLAIDF